MTHVVPLRGGHAMDPALIGWAHDHAQELLEPADRARNP